MARETHEHLLNMSDTATKRRLLALIGTLQGFYDLSIVPRRDIRSNRQNAFYHAVIVKAFMEFQNSQGETMTHEEAHEFFKLRFLRRSVVNKDSGEIIGETVGSTTKLDTAGFSEYLDKCIAFMAEFGIEIPDPALYLDPVTA